MSGQPSPSRSTFVVSAQDQPSGTGPAPRSPHADAGVGLAPGSTDGTADAPAGGAAGGGARRVGARGGGGSHFRTTPRVLRGVWRVIRVVNAKSATRLT